MLAARVAPSGKQHGLSHLNIASRLAIRLHGSSLPVKEEVSSVYCLLSTRAALVHSSIHRGLEVRLVRPTEHLRGD
jgi:hypothetical protein